MFTPELQLPDNQPVLRPAHLGQYLEAREQWGEYLTTPLMELLKSHSADLAIHEYTLPAFTTHERLHQTPACTIVTPVRVLGEKPLNIWRTPVLLQRECASIGPCEVAVWANTQFSVRWQTMPEAMEAFEDWQNKFTDSGLFTPDFRLRLTHTFLKAHDNFNQIRAGYMDAIAIDALARHFPLDHPIIWLDADTPFIGHGAIRQMRDAIVARKGHFVKANMVLVGEEMDAPFLAQRPEHEKVAAIYALARRMIESNLGPTDPRGYVDESGFGMTLGTYLACGGVGISDPLLGESRTLLARGRAVLDSNIPLVYHLKNARVGNSYRLFARLAQTLDPWQLPDRQDGDDYTDYQTLSQQKNSPIRSGPVAATGVHEMVRRMAARQEALTGTGLKDSQERRLEKIIARCGFAG